MTAATVNRGAARSRPSQREINRRRDERQQCSHGSYEAGPARPYFGPVADGRPGSDYNPAAHGNICLTDTCNYCGSQRQRLVNGWHEETSSWETAREFARRYALRMDAQRAEDAFQQARSAFAAHPCFDGATIATEDYRDRVVVLIRMPDGTDVVAAQAPEMDHAMHRARLNAPALAAALREIAS